MSNKNKKAAEELHRDEGEAAGFVCQRSLPIRVESWFSDRGSHLRVPQPSGQRRFDTEYRGEVTRQIIFGSRPVRSCGFIDHNHTNYRKRFDSNFDRIILILRSIDRCNYSRCSLFGNGWWIGE